MAPRPSRSAAPTHDAPEAYMACRAVDGLRVASRWAIATAVVGRAEVRAALQRLARDLDLGLARVVTRFLRAAARVCGNAARLRLIARMFCGIPVVRPFPDVSNHIVDAVTIGRKGGDGRGPG